MALSEFILSFQVACPIFESDFMEIDSITLFSLAVLLNKFVIESLCSCRYIRFLLRYWLVKHLSQCRQLLLARMVRYS